MKKIKVYDCFPFSGENNLLLARLDLLKDYVDYFVIIEGELDFRGNYKGFMFDTSLSKKYNIRYVQIKKNELLKLSSWEREYLTRNLIMRGIEGAKKHDVIILSDLDEFIDPKKLRVIESNSIYVYTMVWVRVYLNYACLNSFWSHAVSFNKKLLDLYDPIDLRLFKRSLRDSRIYNPVEYVDNSGWHLSYMARKQEAIGSYVTKKVKKFPVDFIRQGDKFLKDNLKNFIYLTNYGIDFLGTKYLIWGRCDNSLSGMPKSTLLILEKNFKKILENTFFKFDKNKIFLINFIARSHIGSKMLSLFVRAYVKTSLTFFRHCQNNSKF